MSAADEGRSIGTLVADATAQVSELMRDEIALVKTELKEDVSRSVKGGVAGIVAALLALLALLPLSMALGFWLQSWLNTSLAVGFLLAGAVYLFFALVFGLIAMLTMKKAPKRDRAASIKESAAVLSAVKPHPRPKPDVLGGAMLADAGPAEGGRVQV